MKSIDTKLKFIELRSQNKSYEQISKELKISKDTCSKWEKECKNDISIIKKDKLKTLYDKYYMTKEKRIQSLGNTLLNINKVLSESDLTLLPIEKLLEYKLKYHTQLKKEYVDFKKLDIPKEIDYETLQEILVQIWDNIHNTDIQTEDIKKELLVFDKLSKEYNNSLTRW